MDYPSFDFPSFFDYELAEADNVYATLATPAPEILSPPTQNSFIDNQMPYSFEPLSIPYPTNQPHNLPVTSDSQDENAPSSMSPPPKKRRKKAPTLSADAWEPYKDRIIQLHIYEGQPLRKVKEAMERECNFIAEYVSSRSI